MEKKKRIFAFWSFSRLSLLFTSFESIWELWKDRPDDFLFDVLRHKRPNRFDKDFRQFHWHFFVWRINETFRNRWSMFHQFSSNFQRFLFVRRHFSFFRLRNRVEKVDRLPVTNDEIRWANFPMCWLAQWLKRFCSSLNEKKHRETW